MRSYEAKIRGIVEEANSYLSERDVVRERAVRLSRDVIRYSGWAVTAVHKGDMDEAREYLKTASLKARELIEATKRYPEIHYSGMVYNALSEYAEAVVFLSVVEGRDVPGYRDLDMPPVPYLQGLGDAVGEVRRLILEYIRRGDIEEAWSLLSFMEAVYTELRRLDYPEALAPGVKHKADVARRLVDDTKSFLIDMDSRTKLSRLLEALQKSINQ